MQNSVVGARQNIAAVQNSVVAAKKNKVAVQHSAAAAKNIASVQSYAITNMQQIVKTT